jgi:hypothetical protein
MSKKPTASTPPLTAARSAMVARVVAAAKGAPEKVQGHLFGILAAWIQEYEEEAEAEAAGSAGQARTAPAEVWGAIVKKAGPPAELDFGGVPAGPAGDRLLDRLALAAEAWRESGRIPEAE